MHTKFSSFYGQWDDFIMSCAVPHAVEDIQILHHNMAIHTHVKHLRRANKGFQYTRLGERQDVRTV